MLLLNAWPKLSGVGIHVTELEQLERRLEAVRGLDECDFVTSTGHWRSRVMVPSLDDFLRTLEQAAMARHRVH